MFEKASEIRAKQREKIRRKAYEKGYKEGCKEVEAEVRGRLQSIVIGKDPATGRIILSADGWERLLDELGKPAGR